MKSPIEQSVKERIKVLAKEREVSFAELWRTLILERFLARLSRSDFRDRFVLKGGTLLAKYLPLGRETKDLDFFVQRLSNSKESLENVLRSVCDIDIDDSFVFEMVKVDVLGHVTLPYTGVQIALLARFGATKTAIRMDLGFGDVVEAIDYPIDLTATTKGPLFERAISLRCYPKEFIFAEKLETVISRGADNTRMKDFHDLYSLVSIGNLSRTSLDKAIELVFNHRKTSLTELPIAFDEEALGRLETGWSLYCRRLKKAKDSPVLPNSLETLVHSINQWLFKVRGPALAQFVE